jgi:hypothetical protein
MGKKEEVGSFQLPEGRVVVKPNLKNSGWIKNPRHAAFFKVEGTYDRLMVPQMRNGQLANVLTDDEKDYLEDVLQLEKNALSIYKKGNENFWFNFIVMLGKEPAYLDLSNPQDYLRYKVILANKQIVAPNIKSLKGRKTYKYYIEDEREVAEIQATKANINKQAWLAYAKISDNKKELRRFLITHNEVFNKATKKIATDSKLEFLQNEVSAIVENKMADFLDIVSSANYDVRATIAEGVQVGVIERKGTKYYLAGGVDKLGDTLLDAVEYISSPANQETRLLIEQRIKAQQ